MENTFTYNITKDTDIIFKPTKIKITPGYKGVGGRNFKIELIQEIHNGFITQEKNEFIPDSLGVEECFSGGFNLDSREPIIDMLKLKEKLEVFGINLIK